MEIYSLIENNKTILKISGRLNFDTFSILENKLEEFNAPNDDIIFDLSELEYISSAGLRIILGYEKKIAQFNHHVIMRGVSSEIMDVFRITGFDKILKFEETIPSIDISNSHIIASGLCGDVYQISEDTILKLYREGFDTSMIEKEKLYAREALIAGVPTAISLNMVKADNRLGILFELINAESLKNVILKDLDHIEDYAYKFADLIKVTHNSLGNSNVLPYRLDEQISIIKNSKYFTNEEKEKALNLAHSLNRGTTCIHGDFHPGNVMYSNDELTFIDMGDFAIGDPYQDIAQVYNVFKAKLPVGLGKTITGLDDEYRLKFYKAFINRYFNNPSDEKLAEIEKEIYKYLVVRAFFYIDNFASTRFENIKIVSDYLKEIN